MLRCLNSSSLLKTIRLTPFAPISCPHNSYYKNYTSRRAHKYFMDLIDMEEIQNFKRQKRADAKRKERGEGKQDGSGPSSSALSAKLKGHPSQSGDVRLSKTLSWILRHGSQSQGLYMRPDGYVRVADLLQNPKFRAVNFQQIEKIVRDDLKTRYNLVYEADLSSDAGECIWWIRANQGHSMKSVTLDLKEIESVSEVPSGVAIHGTNVKAWEIIRREGLSKMKRNHIHLAQGVPGSGVISGMRNSSQVHVYIDIAKAMQAGIKFYLSENGVVLTPGNDEGYLNPMFFQRVESPNHKPIPGLLDESEPAALTDKEVPEATPPAADPDITQVSPSLPDPMPTELSEESDKPVS